MIAIRVGLPTATKEDPCVLNARHCKPAVHRVTTALYAPLGKNCVCTVHDEYLCDLLINYMMHTLVDC